MPESDLYATLFAADGGDFPDYETLKRRRAIAAALAAQRSTAQHPLTRGMEELGTGIGSLIGNMRLAQMERAQRARDRASRAPDGSPTGDGTPQTHLPQTPRPPAPPRAPQPQTPQAPATPPATAPAPTQINPVLHNQTSRAPADVDVVAWNDFNAIDAAAPEALATPGFDTRFNASFARDPGPVEPPPQQMAFTDPVVNPPVDPRAPVPGPNWPPAPPAEPVRDINAFAPATATEPTGAPQVIQPQRPSFAKMDPSSAADLWPKFSAGLKGIESGGARDPYRLVGAATRGDRPYGAYQIMGKNIAPWSKAALGREVSKDEFLANDVIQDEVARHRFTNYVNKYGPEGAAQAWFAGEKGMKNLGATDVHGRLTVASYGKDFMRRIGQDGGTQTAAAPAAPSPYRNVAVQPDVGPRAEIAEIVALNPSPLAQQPSPQLQQVASDVDPEAGTKQMIAEVLANQQRPGGVQLASLSDPARGGGITMPRAEPMGQLPLMQSRQQPVPPKPPPGTPGTELTPDMFNPNPTGMPDMSGMVTPSLELAGGAPEVTPDMMDPFAIPFNQPPAPPAAGGDPNAGIEIPAADHTTAVPAPVEQPAPVRVAQAQLPPGIRPDATGGVFPPPPPPPGDTSQGIRPAPQEVQAPGVLPSAEPIPPVSTTEYPDPGPMPETAIPKRVGPSRNQLLYQRNMNDERLSDRERKRNEQLYNMEEQARREVQTIEIERAKNEREKWEAQVKGKQEFELKRDERRQQEQQRRLAIEEAQQKALTAPIERRIKEIDERIKTATEQAEIDRLKIARDQAEATLEVTRQTILAGKAPPREKLGDQILERQPDGTWKDVTPGTQLGNIKLTEAQARTLKFFERSSLARKQGGSFAAMAGLRDTAAGSVPIGGNYWVSADYQRENSAAEAWIEATLRDASGATIKVEEYPAQKKIYFPQPGDGPQLMADKAERRLNAERSLYDSLGTAKPIAEKYLQDEKAREDKAALDWARSNPNDPRAIEIMRRQGGR